jgi:hypothetical protein
VALGDDQPDAPIHPNNAMRAHPPEADPVRMAAKNRATGGSEPRRYEIRARGPIGPATMQAFPTLTVSRSGQDILLDPN